jgi:glycosyl transferase family 25
VNGKELLASVYFEHASNSDYWFNRSHILSPGEVGCKLSHCKVLSDFLSKNQQSGSLCIFEDDITLKIPQTELNTLSSYVASMKNPAVLHLGGLEGLKNTNRLLMYKSESINGLSIYRTSKITLRWLYRTCAYLVNIKGAEVLLRTLGSSNIPADNWNYISKRNSDLRIFYADVVSHPMDLSTSSINCERMFKK